MYMNIHIIYIYAVGKMYVMEEGKYKNKTHIVWQKWHYAYAFCR